MKKLDWTFGVLAVGGRPGTRRRPARAKVDTIESTRAEQLGPEITTARVAVVSAWSSVKGRIRR